MGTGSASDTTRKRIQRVFSEGEVSHAPLAASEIAERVDCSEQVVRETLEDLRSRGKLRTRLVSDTLRVWWSGDGEVSERQTGADELRSFVRAVEDYAIFMLDHEGVVASWNEGAERIKGYREEEIVGDHFSAFYTESDTESGVPGENLEIALEEGRVEDEGWRVRKDGTRFWANVTITAIRDGEGTLLGFTKVTRDMTEQREYEQQLRQERDFTEQILETVPVSVFVATADGEIVRANKRVLDELGLDRSDLSDFDLDSTDIYDEEGEPISFERLLNRIVESGEPLNHFEYQVDHPEIGRRWLSLNAAPLDDSNTDSERVVFAVDDITEQKSREQRLRRESSQTKKLLQTVPIAIAVQDADGNTLMANRHAREALGISEQELIEGFEDSDEWEIFDETGEPVDLSEILTERVLSTGEPVYDERVTIEAATGERKQFRANAAPVFGDDGTIERIITVGEDITELKEQERQLKRRKAELETELSEIFGRVSDAFYALDDDWRFTHLNDHAAELMQHSKEELLGREFWDVFPSATDVYRENFQAAMETQESVTFEMYAEDVGVWLEFNVYPSDTGLSIYFRDVTERREYEQKLKVSNERLEQFAYAASHDLQEPLRMVSSYLQLIDDRYADKLDQDGREFLEFAVDGADRMRNMIDGLLTYSRVDTRGDPFEPVDLNDVIADVRDDFRMRIEESDAEIEVGTLPCVEGDSDQLRQVFQNLLKNAIEYSGDEPPQVRIEAERTDELWSISVRDEGIGIDPEDTERIFKIFHSLQDQTEHSGTGIGLTICERIVERHGGDVWVESTPGKGSTFTFTLPT